jgi:hypothetical protein
LANPNVDRRIEPHVNGTGDRLTRLNAMRQPLEGQLRRRLELLDEAMDLVADASGVVTPPVERIEIRGVDINDLLHRHERKAWTWHFGGDPGEGQPRPRGGLRVDAAEATSRERTQEALRWCRATTDTWAQLQVIETGEAWVGHVTDVSTCDGGLRLRVSLPATARTDQNVTVWRSPQHPDITWRVAGLTPDPASRRWTCELTANGLVMDPPSLGDRVVLLPVDALSELKRSLAPLTVRERLWSSTTLLPRAAS